MKYIEDIASDQPSGFCYDNYCRNQFLQKNKIVPEPKAVKTGTTIAGMIFKVCFINTLGRCRARRRYKVNSWANSSKQELS